MHELAGIFVSTFIAEDLTAISTGLLVHEGRIGLVAGIVACAAGIWIGDLGLWAAGRAASSIGPTVQAGRMARRLPLLILGSRLLPGTRLPLYLTAGAGGIPLRRFAFWSFVAVATWTPAVIILTAAFGSRLADALAAYLGSGWIAVGVTAVLLVVVARGTLLGFRRLSRTAAVRRAADVLGRLRRWEFWPMWLFYGPVAAWTLWLAFRHGGFSTITAANPGIPDGGVVGESKYDIMRRLPRRWALTSIPVRPGSTGDRVRLLLDGMRRASLAWPVILKPDVGQRGTGVKLARSLRDARDYLARFPGAVVAQPYHEGPYEAGIFYYRFPGEPKGRILSITDKHFPAVTGDGISTLATLVRAHDRYRMQAPTFLARLGAGAERVPSAGERVALGIAGNHAQGTLFRSGRHLITPELSDRIDRIARSYDGFSVGRFDVRYANVEAFKAGRDLAIVELNGATAESTDIYDPENTLLHAYGRLFRQWSLVFAIGAANRAAGARVTSPRRLFSLVRAHLTTPTAFPVAD
jgi:membrane protein DedA with SNARE-associated domain